MKTGERDEMLTVRQIMAELRIGKTTAWNLLQRGDLGYHRFGDKVIRVPRAELDAYKERTRCQGSPTTGDAA